MADRIKGIGAGSVGSASSSGAPVEQVRATAPLSTATGAPQPGADSVNITDSARQLSALAQAVNATPAMDTQRVAQLQQAISNGQYTIDPARIADRLLQMEQDLGAAR